MQLSQHQNLDENLENFHSRKKKYPFRPNIHPPLSRKGKSV